MMLAMRAYDLMLAFHAPLSPYTSAIEPIHLRSLQDIAAVLANLQEDFNHDCPNFHSKDADARWSNLLMDLIQQR